MGEKNKFFFLSELGFKRALLVFLETYPSFGADIKFNTSIADTDPAKLYEGGFKVTVSHNSYFILQLSCQTKETVTLLLNKVKTNEPSFQWPIQ